MPKTFSSASDLVTTDDIGLIIIALVALLMALLGII
jgi:hypothetical protein